MRFISNIFVITLVSVFNFLATTPIVFADNLELKSEAEFPGDRVERIVEEIKDGEKIELEDSVFMRGPEIVEDTYVIFVEEERISRGISSLGDYSSAVVKGTFDGVTAVEIKMDKASSIESQLEKIDKDENVLAVTQVGRRDITVYPSSPNDPRFPPSGSFSNSYQWYLNAVSDGYYGIDLLRAWEYLDSNGKSYGGDPSITVAVIDSGLAYEDYEDLDSGIQYGKSLDITDSIYVNGGEIAGNSIDDDGNGCVDDVHGYDLIGDVCGQPNDMVGHGTAVANVISAKVDNDNSGVGIAPTVTVLPIKIFGFVESGESWNRVGGTSVDVGDAITYAVEQGASIINMSFGGSGAYVYEQLAVDDAYYNHDVVLVAAAGNRQNDDVVEYPAAYDSVIAVGASSKTGNRASYSSYGSDLDLVAPVDAGIRTETYNCYYSQTNYNPVCPLNHESGSYSDFGTTYITAGTSFASPQVAAVAALIRTLYPTWNAEQVRYVLRFSAVRKNSSRYDIYTGFGVLNAYNAVRAVDQKGRDLKSRYRVIFAVRGTDSNVYTRYSDDFGTKYNGWYIESNQEGSYDKVSMLYHTATGKVIQYKRGDVRRIYWRFSSDYGTTWTNWSQNGHTKGQVRVVEVQNGRLVMTVRGLDNEILTRYSDNGGKLWSDWRENGSTYSNVNTSYDSHQSRVIQVVQGLDNGIYTRISKTNGSTWGKWVKNGATPGEISMIQNHNVTVQAVRGLDNGVYTRYSKNGGDSWTKWLRDGSTISDPTLLRTGSAVLLAVMGGNKGIWMRFGSDRGTKWGNWKMNDYTESGISMVYNGYFKRVYQTVRKSGNVIYTRFSDDFGSSWSSWDRQGSGYSDVSMVDVKTATW